MQHIVQLLLAHGALVVFIVLFVESLGVPSPSELTLVAAGALIAEGRLNFALVIVAGSLGSFAGAQVSYLIGRRGGRALVLQYGRRVGLTEARLGQVETFFRRYGVLAVLIGRILSGVRAVISYPAGIFAMPWPAFAVATLVGAILWPLIATLLGALLGRAAAHLSLLLQHPFLLGLGLLLLAAVLLWVWRRRRTATKGPLS
jgi:membrane protein DedA with SNARE-associated domain